MLVYNLPGKRERRWTLTIAVLSFLSNTSSATMDHGWWALAALAASAPVGMACQIAVYMLMKQRLRLTLWVLAALCPIATAWAAIAPFGLEGLGNITRYFLG